MAVTVDQSNCTGCGRCAQICPMGAITIDQVAEIEAAPCADCCVCVGKCPHAALGLPESMVLPRLSWQDLEEINHEKGVVSTLRS